MSTERLRYAGFSIGGIDALASDLADAATPEDRCARIESVAREEARLTHALGGNLLRLFYRHGPLLRGPATAAFPILDDTECLPEAPDAIAERFFREPWRALALDEQVLYLRHLEKALAAQLAHVEAASPDGDGLDFSEIDAYLRGVDAFNAETGGPRPVRVLLTLLLGPPRPIIECPDRAHLAYARCGFTFATLFGAYNQIQCRLTERIAERYVNAKPFGCVVCAFEVNNEPDYEWLPDELRILWSRRPSASPLGKYVTEMHLAQIPHEADPNAPCVETPWAGFAEQFGAWRDHTIPEPLEIGSYDYGRKFRWYVRCYTETAKHVAYAIRKHCRTRTVDIVSAGVTHNNVHFLMEMHRVDPDAFAYCTAIGVHPYHWPNHDVHDSDFWTDRDYYGWKSASPREYASEYFKRFDFLREIHRMTTASGARACGLAGKKIWITEFGIGTKMRGAFNAEHPELAAVILPRGAATADGATEKSWEDLWTAFFAQARVEALAACGVEAMAFYTLREAGAPHLDKHDDDRSNLALLRRNGKPRLAPDVFARFAGFFDAGGAAPGLGALSSVVPRWGRAKRFSTPLLRAAPWRAARLPATVVDCLSMMTEDEKKLLFWATSEYFTDCGEVVDAGSFVGGSTVALAEGLRDSWPDTDRLVRSYDKFETDPFMDQFYFQPNGLALDGTRFRNVFDVNTAPVRSLVEVHDGDITRLTWDRGPVELLFIDICKAWVVDDHVTRMFFPHLIPGRSLVFQQDFFHHWCPWLAITMEIFSEEFEFIDLVKWNTAVFRCVKPIDVEKRPAALRERPFDELSALMRRQIERHDDVYRRGVLLCAYMVLAGEYGERDMALALEREILAGPVEHPEVRGPLAQVRVALGLDGGA